MNTQTMQTAKPIHDYVILKEDDPTYAANVLAHIPAALDALAAIDFAERYKHVRISAGEMRDLAHTMVLLQRIQAVNNTVKPAAQIAAVSTEQTK